MRHGILVSLVMILLMPLAEAGVPRESPPLTDTALANFLDDLAAHLNTLECLTADPDGTTNPPGVLGTHGELKCANYGGNHYICMNTSTGPNKGTAWSCLNVVAAGSPSPPIDSVQFNNPLGTFDGDAALTFVDSTDLFTLDPADTTAVTAEDIAFLSANQSITLSDGTTLANQRQNQFFAPTINGVAGGSTETVTNAATLYVSGMPIDGGNVTFTNGPYNAWFDDGGTGTASSKFESAIEMTNVSVPSAKSNTIFLTQADRTGENTRRGLVIVPESGTGHYFGDNVGINTMGPGDLFVVCQQSTCTNWTTQNASAMTWNDSNTSGGEVAELNFDIHPPSVGATRALTLVFDNSYTDSSFIITKDQVTGLSKEIPFLVSGTRSSATVPTFIGNTVAITDGTTLANYRFNSFWGPTVNGVVGGGTETITNAATVYINAAPSGSNLTFTNGPYALWVDDGAVRFDGAVTVGSLDTGGGTALELAAGQWSPSSNNIANLDSSSAAEGQYLRVGATVTGSVQLTVDPTLTATSTQLELDLPVASNFGATSDAAGSCGGSDIASEVAEIRADVTSDELEAIWITNSAASHELSCSFSYQLL